MATVSEVIHNGDTLPAGTYKGLFVGVYPAPVGDGQYVILSSSRGAHVETTAIDVSGLQPMQSVEFTISFSDGYALDRRGLKYRLVDTRSSEHITGWLPLEEILKQVRDSKHPMASFQLTSIKPI